MKKNQYSSREATLLGWTVFTLKGRTCSDIKEIKNWLEDNIKGRWSTAGFGGNDKAHGVTFRFENEEEGVYTRMVW